MESFRPCGGLRLSECAKIVAWVDVITTILIITARVSVFDATEFKEAVGLGRKHIMLAHAELAPENQTRDTKIVIRETFWCKFVLLILLSILLTVGLTIFEVWLGWLLIEASKKGEAGNCRKWLFLRLFSTIVYYLCIACAIFSFDYRHDWIDWGIELALLTKFYELFVVYEFQREITGSRWLF